MQIYGLKNCDTCRKAMNALPGATLIDVRADGVPEDVLTRAFETFGDKLLNTRSATWRQLDEAARRLPPLDVIKAAPTVMKRPLIAVDDKLFLGFSKDVEAEVRAAL